MVGEEVTLIGVYGDSSRLPMGEIEELAGVEQLIPISKAYKRAAQKGAPDRPIYQAVPIGGVVCGGEELVVIAGPCSVESEAQIVEAARLVKEAGAQCLRGGLVKDRSSPHSGWEGLGPGPTRALKRRPPPRRKAGGPFRSPAPVQTPDPGPRR